MKLGGMTRQEDIPENYHGSKQMKLLWLRRMARRIVDECWRPLSQEDVRTVADASTGDETTNEEDAYPFCFCREGSMVLSLFLGQFHYQGLYILFHV